MLFCLRRVLLSSCVAKKKVSKEEGDPGSSPGCARSPALLERPGGCGTRACGPQTVLAESPRPSCVARRLSRGPVNHPCSADEFRFWALFRPDRSIPLDSPLSPDAFRVPLRGAEQRRRAGGFRLAVFEPQASLASRPVCRVAQGTGVAGADLGVAFSLATFFWRSKRKYARPQGGKQGFRKAIPR